MFRLFLCLAFTGMLLSARLPEKDDELQLSQEHIFHRNFKSLSTTVSTKSGISSIEGGKDDLKTDPGDPSLSDTTLSQQYDALEITRNNYLNSASGRAHRTVVATTTVTSITDSETPPSRTRLIRDILIAFGSIVSTAAVFRYFWHLIRRYRNSTGEPEPIQHIPIYVEENRIPFATPINAHGGRANFRDHGDVILNNLSSDSDTVSSTDSQSNDTSDDSVTRESNRYHRRGERQPINRTRQDQINATLTEHRMSATSGYHGHVSRISAARTLETIVESSQENVNSVLTGRNTATRSSYNQMHDDRTPSRNVRTRQDDKRTIRTDAMDYSWWMKEDVQIGQDPMVSHDDGIELKEFFNTNPEEHVHDLTHGFDLGHPSAFALCRGVRQNDSINALRRGSILGHEPDIEHETSFARILPTIPEGQYVVPAQTRYYHNHRSENEESRRGARGAITLQRNPLNRDNQEEAREKNYGRPSQQ